MPTIFTHPAVPLALGLALGLRRLSPRLIAAGAFASILPDFDSVAFKLGIAYADQFGHRGATHPLLDVLTNGGLGVALLWPWSHDRLFAPWRPIAVSPIGAGFFSARGLTVLWSESFWVWIPASILACVGWASRRLFMRRRAGARPRITSGASSTIDA